MARMKRCNKARCRTLVDWSEGYCEEHKGSAEKEYNKSVRYNNDNREASKYYNGREWKLLREEVLREQDYRCARCREEGRINLSNRLIVHHKYNELKDIINDDIARLDKRNLEVLCQTHHNQITGENIREQNKK